MKGLSLVAFAVVLSGCAIDPISERGTFLTYGHGSRESAFKEAYDHAAQACEKKGLVAMHMSSVCPDRCITNFECVKR
jgi:hypothetical protein